MATLYAQLREYHDHLQAMPAASDAGGYESFSKSVLTLEPAPATGPTVSAADVATCPQALRPFFLQFHSPDTGTVLSGLTGATQYLTEHRSEIPGTCLGNGAEHITHVVKRFLDGDLTLLRHALRLLTVASSTLDTEVVFLRAGGLGLAMEALSQGRLDVETRYTAALLFFNFCEVRSNRRAFIEEGALRHVCAMVMPHDASVDTEHSGRGLDIVRVHTYSCVTCMFHVGVVIVDCCTCCSCCCCTCMRMHVYVYVCMCVCACVDRLTWRCMRSFSCLSHTPAIVCVAAVARSKHVGQARKRGGCVRRRGGLASIPPSMDRPRDTQQAMRARCGSVDCVSPCELR